MNKLKILNLWLPYSKLIPSIMGVSYGYFRQHKKKLLRENANKIDAYFKAFEFDLNGLSYYKKSKYKHLKENN